MQRSVVLLLALVCAPLFVSGARAESRVVVRPFYGPHADNVREAIEDSLDKRSAVILVSSKEADHSAKQLDVDANSPEGRRVVARELQIAAWVEGIVQKQGNKLRATVLIYDGANHERIARSVTVQKNKTALLSTLKRMFWKENKNVIARANPPAPDASSPPSGGSSGDALATSDDESSSTDDTAAQIVAQATDDIAAASPEPSAPSSGVRATSTATTFLPAFTPTVESAAAPRNDAAELAMGSNESANEHAGGPKALVIVLSAGSPFRKLAYSDPLTQNLGDYQLAGAPLVDLRLGYFPGVKYTNEWPSYLGLDLRGQFALGMRTVDSQGNEFKSRYDAYHVGVQGRVPVGRHAVRAFTGYGIQRFSLDAQNKSAAAPTPNVDYRMVRTGVGGELALGEKLAIGAEAGWLYLLSVGDIGSADWFPRTKAGGIEASVDATYAINDRYFARGFVSYQRIFFDFRSQPNDRVVAGGAADTYLTLGLGAGVRL